MANPANCPLSKSHRFLHQNASSRSAMERGLNICWARIAWQATTRSTCFRMRTAKKIYPTLSARELVEMVTLCQRAPEAPRGAGQDRPRLLCRFHRGSFQGPHHGCVRSNYSKQRTNTMDDGKRTDFKVTRSVTLCFACSCLWRRPSARLRKRVRRRPPTSAVEKEPEVFAESAALIDSFTSEFSTSKRERNSIPGQPTKIKLLCW